jgi:hypothetical protein
MPAMITPRPVLEQTALTAVGGGSLLRIDPTGPARWRALVVTRGGRPVAVDLDTELGTVSVFPRTAVPEPVAA